MARKYKVSGPRKFEADGKEKTSWKQLGFAVDAKNGIRVNINFLPLVKDGEPESFFLFPLEEGESS